VDWLFLGALGIIWLALLLPGHRRRPSPGSQVHDFERRMELLAYSEVQGTPGRWIVTPRKGMRFVGTAERHRARARERRRKVLAFLLESIGLTLLIGLVPPLRAVWYLTATLGVLLAVYVWLLVSIKNRASAGSAQARAVTPGRGYEAAAAVARYVAEGRSTWARPNFNGLGALGESDRVHVVVRHAARAVGG
jgi:hypothetical protein